MTRVLVTGGLGFVGSHLVEKLLREDNQVVVVDNLTGGGSLEFYHEIIHEDSLPLEISTESIQEFAKLNIQRNFSHIFHLASPVGPAGLVNLGGSIADEIISGTMAAVKLAQENDCRLTFVSTSEVYGGGTDGLCREDMPCIVPPKHSPRLEYALGKLTAEQMLLNMEYGPDLVIIRPFNIAGPRQSTAGGFVIPSFVGQAIWGEDLTVFEGGEQIRAFTHVSDIVDGIISAARIGTANSIYNLGNIKNKTKILDLAKLVIKQTKSKSKIWFTSGNYLFGPGYAEAANKFPDATKAMRELDWKPKYSNEDIVNEVIEYELSRLPR